MDECSPVYTTSVVMASNCDDSLEHHALQELTSEDKRYAAVHLNETDETREEAIAEIRRWIQESDLSAGIDDFLILQFLRVCKFNLEKTKIRIENYFKQRSHLPEWFINKDPFEPELQELLDMGVFLPLRKPDCQGRIVFLIQGTMHDPRRHKISQIIKLGMMVTKVAIKNYTAATVYGCSALIDVSNPTMRLAVQMQPQVIMNMVHLWQSSYPLRIQSIIMINAPAYVDVVAKIFRSFMTEKMKNRFHVYTQKTMPDYFEDIPANILPVEYGGTGDTCQELIEYWKKLLMENRDWLTDDEDNKIVISKQ